MATFLTACLQLYRQNSDLGEGVGKSLRKQALTHSSSGEHFLLNCTVFCFLLPLFHFTSLSEPAPSLLPLRVHLQPLLPLRAPGLQPEPCFKLPYGALLLFLLLHNSRRQQGQAEAEINSSSESGILQFDMLECSMGQLKAGNMPTFCAAKVCLSPPKNVC